MEKLKNFLKNNFIITTMKGDKIVAGREYPRKRVLVNFEIVKKCDAYYVAFYKRFWSLGWFYTQGQKDFTSEKEVIRFIREFSS